MKRAISILFATLLILSMVGCVSSDKAGAVPDAAALTESPLPSPKPETAEDFANALKDAGQPIGEIEVWTAETDPNKQLGRPNQYTSKTDFEDTTLEQTDPEYLTGGTIEVFATNDDCQARYDYLNQFADPSLGAMGLNQYMYKGEKVILRVSYDVVPDEAAKYETAFKDILK